LKLPNSIFSFTGIVYLYSLENKYRSQPSEHCKPSDCWFFQEASIDLNEAYYWKERRALGKSILEKEIVERAIIRIIHKKIIEVYTKKNVHTFKPRVKIIIFMQLNTLTVWEGEPNTAWSKGENMEMGKNTIFLSPINLLQVFSGTRRKKLDQGGKYYIVSPQAHIQEAV
jgi:hypothetical protein